MANIEIAKSAGFCFGVKRALDIVNQLYDKGEKVFTYGPIIHNPLVINEMKSKGIEIAEQIEKNKLNGATLVIRSHGVSKDIIKNLEQSDISFIDATCPFVKKIHRIVDEINKENDILFIAGDKNHPEIQGIIGNTKAKCYTFNNSDELLKIMENNKDFIKSPVYLVAQTTFSTSEWEKCLDIFKKVYTNAKIFDTICSATAFRQKEAFDLSRRADLMIVIGGKNSSNTKKLYEICCKNCMTYHIESLNELPKEQILKSKLIGITAGASTPVSIIEEVAKLMQEILSKENMDNMEPEVSFEEMLEESLKNLNTDDKVRGLVVGISPNEVYVDVGRKQSGYIPLSELSADKNAKPEDIVKIGDELDLLIMRTNDQEGTIMLSKRRLDAAKGWDVLSKAEQEGTILTGKVTEIIKGGVIAVTKENVRVFIPASQATAFKGEPLEELKGKEVQFKIIETNKARRRAVASIRAVLNEQRKQLEEKFFETIEIGKFYTGTIRSFTAYGAFVDLGGVDGMIHISELSWNKIKHPSDVLKLGQTVEVYIKDFDQEKKRISLGYKKAEENPWEVLKSKYSMGDTIEAQIVGISSFGAFARVLPGIDGLIHISQISDNKIEKVEDAISVGDIVCAKIVGIDFDKKRVALSIKALNEETTGSIEK